MPLLSQIGRTRICEVNVAVIVCVCVCGPVVVAALVNGNDTVAVIDAVSEHAT